MGDDALRFDGLCRKLADLCSSYGYKPVILPALWEQATFVDKAGPEIVNQMWAFLDKSRRPVCLIPEATALIQEMWRDEWSKQPQYAHAPLRLFYCTRCYRYERPQAGRYREFTQFGIEILGEPQSRSLPEALSMLKACLRLFPVDYRLDTAVKRGLDYYTSDGFEAVCDQLGAQKQIAGGGPYDYGLGWAIGVDRLLLAMDTASATPK